MTVLAQDNNSTAIQALRPASTQVFAASGSAASSTTFSTVVVRLYSTVDCFFSVTGTATTSSCPLPAGAVEFIRVNSSDVVSVITNGGTGTFYVTEML
jgi:hypothetical protein